MMDFLDTLTASIGITDAIDVAIIAYIIYKILEFIRETRAEQLIKGLLFLVVATFLSGVFNFYALNWVLKYLMQFGMIALVVVFQPELRRGLEYMGRSKFMKPEFKQVHKEKTKQMVSAIVKAIDYFSVNKVGALIIIEREVTLSDIAESGVVLDSEVSEAMLKNIFYQGAPLHDGAAILRGSTIHAAGCVLPLSKNKDLPLDLGTRHIAGIGVTEISDAIAFIVSEETGIISMSREGKLTRFLEIKNIEKTLLGLFLDSADTKRSFRQIVKFWEKGKKRDGNAAEQ